MKDALRQQVLAEKAADIIYDRANKVDNILASGSGLDELPTDLGLAGVTGTMDAEGNTLDGKPAPIPGGDAVRKALIEAAFQAHKGDPPRLTEVPLKGPGGGSAYYALSVEEVMPPAPKPFAQVKDTVLADWTRDALRRTQETAAAKLMTAVKQGQTLADAAAVAGVAMTRTPLTGREQPVSGMPPELLRPLFELKPGEPTMVETADGFIVAVPAEIVTPDPASDPAGYEPGARRDGQGGRPGRRRDVRADIARARPAAHQSGEPGQHQRPVAIATIREVEGTHDERRRPTRFRRLPVGLRGRARLAGVATRRGGPGDAGGGLPQAGARQAERLPAGERGGRRGARALLDHRDGPGPDLALPRRPRRGQSLRAVGAARVRGGDARRRWTACAR